MKSATQKAWLLGLVIVTAAPATLRGQKVLTFDALPSGATFSSYTQDGITPGDLNKIRTLLDRAKPTSAEDGAWKSGKSPRSK